MSAARRRPLAAGNWKMHKVSAQARQLASELRVLLDATLDPAAGVEVVLAPPFTALSVVRGALNGSAIGLAAQNVHYEKQGAFTGEVSAEMLVDAGCSYVIVGHSERRQIFGETDDLVARKARAVLDAGMAPIVCVGETLAQRESGETEAVVLTQVARALDGRDHDALSRVVVAYEPIWAIGTGRNAEPTDAQAVHAAIRHRVAGKHGEELAATMRVLYGGSVKPGNARALMAQPDIDGALVGGASLEADSFRAIVEAAEAGEVSS